MEAEGGEAEASERIHVRRLDVVDTLRWSWYALTDHLELVALTFVVGLLSVVSTLGVSQPTPADPAAPPAPPEFADWVFPVYLVYFLALLVLWGVVYLTAEDAVAERSRSLGDRLGTGFRRLPWLILVGVVVFPVVAVGFALLVLPGIYLLTRLSLAFPACVIDGKGPIASAKAGWRASSRNKLKVFAVGVAYFVLAFLTTLVAGVFGGPDNLLGSLVSNALSAVLFPLFGLALGHLYLEGSRNE